MPLAVAVSAGADSTALLLACARRWPGQVRAIHVHHGLQDAADQFEARCQALCAQLAVPLVVERVDARHGPGESPEAAARQARYQALARAAASAWPDGPCRDIALAQHADDQVETMLLALSRGAGLPGLAAMPACWERGGFVWHRPLLELPGGELRRWLAAQGVGWEEDPSNQWQHLTRNRIRAQLLPALESAFPQFRATFARSARHAAAAQVLLDALAQQDLSTTGAPPRIAPLRALARERQANVLRHWLRTSHDEAPSAAQLEELLDQLADCATRGHQLRLKVGQGLVQRVDDRLAYTR